MVPRNSVSCRVSVGVDYATGDTKHPNLCEVRDYVFFCARAKHHVEHVIVHAYIQSTRVLHTWYVIAWDRLYAFPCNVIA